MFNIFCFTVKTKMFGFDQKYVELLLPAKQR